MARLIDGEYWITDSSGQTTYADGDVGDTNHEAAAHDAALGIDEFEADKLSEKHGLEIADFFPPVKITPDDREALLEHGANEAYLDWLQGGGKDARSYAIEHMGWVRVRGDNFQFWKMDEATLKAIRNFDEWQNVEDSENLETSEETVNLEEASSGEYGEIELKDLFNTELQPYQIKRIFSGGDVRENPGNPPEFRKATDDWFEQALPGVLEQFPKAQQVNALSRTLGRLSPAIIDYDWLKNIPLIVGVNPGDITQVHTEFDFMRAYPIIFASVIIYSNKSKIGVETGLKSAFEELDTFVNLALAGYEFKKFYRDAKDFKSLLDEYFVIESMALEDPRKSEFMAMINMRPPHAFGESFIIRFDPNQPSWGQLTMVLELDRMLHAHDFIDLTDKFFLEIGANPWDAARDRRAAGQGMIADSIESLLRRWNVQDYSREGA